MLTILIGRAKTGKSDTILRRMAELGESSQQILLVPEHASHQAEVDVCSACGDTASRHAEVLSFRRLGERVLSITGGIADVTLDNGGKLLTLQRALLETAPQMTVYRKPSQKVGFLEQMLALFDELRSYEVTPEILYQQAQDMDGSTHDKLTDLSLLYAAYEARLRRSRSGRPGPDDQALRPFGGVRVCAGQGHFHRRLHLFQRAGAAGAGGFSAAGPVCYDHVTWRSQQPGGDL